MTVRVWLKPNDLGETGYFIDFPEADNYALTRLKNGTNVLSLTSSLREGTGEVGRISGDRWDAVVVMDPAS